MIKQYLEKNISSGPLNQQQADRNKNYFSNNQQFRKASLASLQDQICAKDLTEVQKQKFFNLILDKMDFTIFLLKVKNLVILMKKKDVMEKVQQDQDLKDAFDSCIKQGDKSSYESSQSSSTQSSESQEQHKQEDSQSESSQSSSTQSSESQEQLKKNHTLILK